MTGAEWEGMTRRLEPDTVHRFTWGEVRRRERTRRRERRRVRVRRRVRGKRRTGRGRGTVLS